MIETQSFKNLDDRISLLEEKVNKLALQEKYIEMQKSWSESLTRIAMNTISTYVLVVLLMIFFNIENYFMNALIPALGYALSIQSIPFVKKIWIRKYLESEKSSRTSEDTGRVFKN